MVKLIVVELERQGKYPELSLMKYQVDFKN